MARAKVAHAKSRMDLSIWLLAKGIATFGNGYTQTK